MPDRENRRLILTEVDVFDNAFDTPRQHLAGSDWRRPQIDNPHTECLLRELKDRSGVCEKSGAWQRQHTSQKDREERRRPAVKRLCGIVPWTLHLK